MGATRPHRAGVGLGRGTRPWLGCPHRDQSGQCSPGTATRRAALDMAREAAELAAARARVAEQFAERDRAALTPPGAPPWPGKAAPPPAVSPPRPRRPPRHGAPGRGRRDLAPRRGGCAARGLPQPDRFCRWRVVQLPARRARSRAGSLRAALGERVVIIAVVLGVLGEAFRKSGRLRCRGRVVVDGVGEIENIIANATEASSASAHRVTSHRTRCNASRSARTRSAASALSSSSATTGDRICTTAGDRRGTSTTRTGWRSPCGSHGAFGVG